MDGLVMPLEMDSPLRKGFAFVPIVAKSDDVEEGPSLRIGASLAIRDILLLIAKANLSIPVKEFASQLLSVSGKASIRNALDIMLQKGIRNIGISEEFPYGIDSGAKRDERDKGVNLCRIIDDGMILEFLLSHSGREVLRRKGMVRLEDINVTENLNTTYPTAVIFDTSVSSAAELLMDLRNLFLIYKSNEKERKECLYIITPWDIVIKLLTRFKPNII